MTIALNSLDFDLRKYRLVRKHVPRDGNSFFRCFADRLLGSQRKHPEIRTRLQDYCNASDKWPVLDDIFSKQNAVPELLSLAVSCFAVPVTLFERKAATGAMTRTVFISSTDQSDDSDVSSVCVTVYLFDSQLQFDLVLTEERVLIDSVAQALAYEALYAGVFGMDKEAIQVSLDEMLCSKRFVRLKQERKRLAYQADEESPLPPELSCLPPVPYRIAKALDPSCYRNVEMDVWLQEVKETTDQEPVNTGVSVFPINTRCLLTDPPDSCRKLVCYITSKAQGNQVQVYVPSFRKKVRCDVRNLVVVAADRKSSRRSFDRTPDPRRGPGDENWLRPNSCIINQHPVHDNYYPLPLIPSKYPALPPAAGAANFQYLMSLHHRPHFMLTSFSPATPFSQSASSCGGSSSSADSPCWSPSPYFVWPSISNVRNPYQFMYQ